MSAKSGTSGKSRRIQGIRLMLETIREISGQGKCPYFFLQFIDFLICLKTRKKINYDHNEIVGFHFPLW